MEKKTEKELLQEVENLRAQVEKLKARKKYGLVWDAEKEPEKVVLDCRKKLPILVEDKKKEIKGKGDEPVNLLIEGDNYHSLSVLNYTHKGKVDVIYIDPPYNTGARDWKYNNDYVDINDNWRHSKWLSFMEKRLKLARNLLKKDGVLICTIDKNEVSTLGVLLQELFPEREIVCVTIVHNPGGIQGLNFSHVNEYAYFIHPRPGTFISKVKKEDAPQRAFRDWGKESSKRTSAKTCFYPIYVKSGEIIGFGDTCQENFHPKNSNIKREDEMIEVYPLDKNGVERKWRFSRGSVESIKDELLPKEIGGEISIFREKQDYRWKTVWTENEYNANVYGTKLLNNIISGNFPYPKSLYAVRDCIKAVIHNKNKAIILDFFAGSGTTGHATMELNKSDKGKRRFILCTNNENNNGDGGGIAEDICYPRIKKIIKGYCGISDKREYKGLGGNLRYYKTDFVETENLDNATDQDKIELTYKAGEMIAIKEETFEEVEKDDWWQIFSNGKEVTAIYFKEDKSKLQKLVEKLDKMDKKVNLYIFSWGKNEYANEFTEYKKIKVKDIPEPLIEVYKEVANI